MNICAIVCQTLLAASFPLALAVPSCFGQTSANERASDPHPTSQFSTVGVKECAACHSHPSPIYEQLLVTSFIRLVEAKEWLDRDKHSAAYQIVRPENNPLTREICQKLGWNPAGPEFSANCLTCHAGVDHRKPILDETTLQFGVQCEACHGAASEWTKVAYHQQENWRAKTPEEKLKLGMWDLLSPSACAEVCFSCHLGDIKQNRFVTHAMYAAGHPPLPPVELQTFLDAMPPHWKPLAEKPLAPTEQARVPDRFGFQDDYFQAHFGPSARTPHVQLAIRKSYRRSQTSLIGGLVAHKIGLELIRDAAEREALWGDYALYDCTACHHELVKPSKRPPPVGRTPGRPLPATWWNLNIDSLSVRNVGPQRATSTVLGAFDKVPFGDRETLAATLEQVFMDEPQWHDVWRVSERQAFSEDQARAWLQSIVRSRMETLSDFSTARQTGWFAQVVVQELVDRNRMARHPTEQLLEDLSKELLASIAKPQNERVADHLAEALDRAEKFDSARCRRILFELANLSSK